MDLETEAQTRVLALRLALEAFISSGPYAFAGSGIESIAERIIEDALKANERFRDFVWGE